MTTKRERIGDFRDLLGKLVRVPKAEVIAAEARHAAKMAKKRARKRKK